MVCGDVELDLGEPPAGIAFEVRAAEPIGDPDWFRERALAEPDGRQPMLRGGGSLQTDEGWPILLIRSDRETQPIEQVHALFVIDDHGIVVVARGATLDAQREAVMAVLRKARPKFAERVAALAQVWDAP